MARLPRELTSIIDVRATIPRNYRGKPREDHDRTFIYADTIALLLDPNALGGNCSRLTGTYLETKEKARITFGFEIRL